MNRRPWPFRRPVKLIDKHVELGTDAPIFGCLRAQARETPLHIG